MPHSLPASSSLARRETAFTGLGFAFGFGWLWFPALQGIWLPGFLWGGLWSGGGTSVFCGLLLTGFAGAILWQSERLREDSSRDGVAEGRNFFSPFTVRRTQAASLLLALFSLLAPLPGDFSPPYIPTLGMALVGCIQGMFWGAALLRLSPLRAGAAFALASAVAALLSLLLTFVPSHLLPFLLCASLGAAWLCAESVVTMREAAALPEPKRRRGRPRLAEEDGTTPETPEQESSVPPHLNSALWAAGILFFFLGMGGDAVAGVIPPTFWIAGTFVACGAALATVFCAYAQKWRQEGGAKDKNAVSRLSRLSKSAHSSPLFRLTAILALLGLDRLILPMSFSLPAALLEGMACVFALAAVAEMPPAVRTADALRRTATTLLLVLLLGNLGASAAQGLALWLGGAEHATLVVRLLGAFALAAAFVVPLVRRVRAREFADPQPTLEQARETDFSVSRGSFTARELEILALVREGLNNKNIADRLFVQDATVRFHLRNICQKTGLTEREELVGLDISPERALQDRYASLHNNLSRREEV